MTPIRESRELDWEGEHMKPNTLMTRPLSTRTKPLDFEKLWRQTQEQFNKMEVRAQKAEAHADKLAEACKWLLSLYDEQGEHREQYQDQCSVACEKAEAALAAYEAAQ